MINGTTKSGFYYEISDDRLDDYELLETICGVDNGNNSLIPKVAELVLGKDQLNELKEHLRNEDGRVKTSDMFREIMEIMKGNDEGKNS